MNIHSNLVVRPASLSAMFV